MILTIDIGNSFAKFGVFAGETFVRRFVVPTRELDSPRKIAESLNDLETIDAIAVSSVVPAANAVVEAFAVSKNIVPLFVHHDLPFGLSIRYKPVEKLGIDRLIAAFAAREKFGAPVIVASFGTATTIDAVSAENEFLGGVIAPGMKTMAESLFARTANLPEVEIAAPESVFGRSTVEAIQSGIFYGYVGLVREITGRMRAQLGADTKIVATGGFAKLLSANCDVIDAVDENFVLEGLRLILKKTARITAK